MTDSITIKLLKTLQRGYDALGEQAKQLMADFIISQRSADGGFVNKQGESDLYYTAFGTLLQYIFNIKFSAEELNDYLDKIDAEGLDLIHYAAYMRCRLLASIAEKTKLGAALKMLSRKEIREQQSFDVWPNNDKNSPYSRFIWLSLLEDTRNDKDSSTENVSALEEYTVTSGGFSNMKGQTIASANATSAALMVIGQLDGYDKGSQGIAYLLKSQLPSGGFKAADNTHMPDLLSTATALFTLRCYGVQPRYSAQEFVEAHWLDNGGFGATILDSSSDVEYLFYGLLALGTL